MTRTEFQKFIAEFPWRVKRLYTDGGTIKKHPSDIGGTWAWCVTDENDDYIYGESGFFPAPKGMDITRFQAEFAALTRGLEALPNGWFGTVCADCELTINRFFKNHSCFNIPPNMLGRGKTALERMGEMKYVLLQSKPTKADIENGTGKRSGLPVSQWNKWCDKKCGDEAKKAIKSLEVEKKEN